MKTIKGALLALIIIAILSGSVYMLMVMDVIPAPAFLQRIPVVGEQLQPGSKRALTPEERLQEKYSALEKELATRDQQIKEMQAQLNQVEKQLQGAEAANKELQAENESLTKQIEELETGQRNQQAAYKDMARYFTGNEGSGCCRTNIPATRAGYYWHSRGNGTP